MAVTDLSEWVRVAARRTLDSGSARVWHGHFSVPAPPHGRSDLVLERFPWLDDEGEDDGEDPEGFSVYVGSARYFGREGNWVQAADGDPAVTRRSPNDPLWIVEALAVVDGVSRPRPDRERVRGVLCRRAAFIEDPRAHASELEVPPPFPLLGRITNAAAGLSHRLTGEVWIGEDGRIHRVSWTRIVVRRPRWPFNAPGSRLWQTTELWDFGVAVDIEIPRLQPEERIRIGEVLAGMRSLWRRKRAYERRAASR